MKRVLIVKMWALGDLLMATPMIAALRAAHPDVHITWCADLFHGELLRGHPGIDELMLLDSGRWRRLLRKGNIPAWLHRTAQLRRDMASRNFDAAINCHPDRWWTATLCVAPRRVALYASPTLPASRRFYTDALLRPKSPQIHNTEYYLLPTRALGCPDADLSMTIGETPDEAPFWDRFCREKGIDASRPVVLFAPFSTGANRNWEPERWSELADRIGKDVNIIMTIGPKDGEAAQEIAARSSMTIHLAAGTDLRQYVSLIRNSDLAVCLDSSAMHIAGAVRTPYVALFGPTPVRERAPMVGVGLAMAKPVPCGPCDTSSCTNPVFRQCMKLLEVPEVEEAVRGLLAKSPAAGKM